jgi:NADH:ubiquinone oxidoreductase subunit H
VRYYIGCDPCDDLGINEEWVYGIIGGLLGLVIVAITVILERKVLGGLQLRTRPIAVGW